LLQQKGLLADERIELLTSFRHSGFSVDATPTVWHSDRTGIERSRPLPFALSGLLGAIPLDTGLEGPLLSRQGFSRRHLRQRSQGETLDIFDFLARYRPEGHLSRGKDRQTAVCAWRDPQAATSQP
jgi:hypothetical protein